MKRESSYPIQSPLVCAVCCHTVARALAFTASVLSLGAGFNAFAQERPSIIVLTDISNEPDDEESMVRFLVYANEFDVEGLIATTSTHLKGQTREDLIRRDIAAYGQVRSNLVKHAPGFLEPEKLLAVTKTGQSSYGMAAVGEGKSTPGSRQIIEAVDRADERPVWVSVWGGANTLAQALWDVKASRDETALDKFVSKLRVYTISDQDDAGYWLRREFPKLFYIASPSTVGGSEYWRATWTGISGDRRHTTGVMHKFEMVDNPWLEKNIIKDHGPLGALYPRLAFIMEGDTPSFLGLINHGLGWEISPSYGGWGGRYTLFQPYGETRRIWTESRESRDTVTSDDNGRTDTSHQATIWRWREHFQNDFAARMDWCVADDFKKANHNPIAMLAGDKTKKVIEATVTPGATTVMLSAVGSSDPDGDQIKARWWIYREAGTFRGNLKLDAETGLATSFTIPAVTRTETIHVILELRDNGTPNLFAYRRAVITVPVGGK
jgi:hypothetical protein